MMNQIFKFLFSDNFRVYATAVLLVAILSTTIGSWVFPKQPSLSSDAIKTLKEVSDQIKETANVLNKQSLTTTKLNEKLTKQLEDIESSRNENYRKLLDKYGIAWGEIDSSSIDFRNYLDDPESLDRLFEKYEYTGDRDLFGESELKGGNKQLSESPTHK